MRDLPARPITPEEKAELAHATDWINDVLERGFRSKIRLTGSSADISTLHSLLSKGPFSADAAAELTAFGTVFGEILAREVPMRWVVYQDEAGTDFALQYRDLALFVFPCDMILKRVEEGEAVDHINLATILSEVREKIQSEAPNAAKLPVQ
jgi:hypothetical protein